MRSSLFAVVVTALVLAGCGRDKAEAPAGAAATPTVDPAAEAFVRSLYALANGGTNSTDTSADVYGGAIWSARTAGLVDQARALTAAGDEGYFESDPFCGCQDDSGMRLSSVTVTPRDADHAEAAVVMSWTEADPVATVRQTFDLVRENGVWRIDDIERDPDAEATEPPLVEDLTQWIADARAHPAV